MYIKREIKEEFKLLSLEYNIIALVGARQAGKTTFLKENASAKTSYLIFDDPDVRELFNEDIKKFEKQYLEGHEIVILDEVQYGTESGRKLKYLADKGRRLWITSSSQIVLSKEILSWLVGRVSILRLYPFSIAEFLKAKNLKETTEKILKRELWEHIIYGGYPKIVLTENIEMKKRLLQDLYETMVLKDVAQTFSIENVRSLEEFVRYLAHSIGNVLIYEKASDSMDLSFETTKKYLDAMEKSYLIKRLQPFYTNKLKEITKQPKIYFIDNGLRNIIAKHFPITSENEGRLFENYIFTELVKMNLNIKYWQTKNKAEVDFIVEKGEEIIPIEVKVNARSKKIGRSLRSFITTYRPKRAIVVYYEGEKTKSKVNGCEVTFTDIIGMKEFMKK